MQAAAWVVHGEPDPGIRGREFYDVTVALLSVCLVGGVLATAYCAGRKRRWTGLLVAFAPALILGAFINWDLIAMALSMAALAAWAARAAGRRGPAARPGGGDQVLPGDLPGAAVPALPARRPLREFWLTAGSAVGAWLVVNLPIAVAAHVRLGNFYIFNAKRGADWGSIWYFFQTEHWPVVGGLSLSAINLTSAALFLAACAGVAALALAAPRRPQAAAADLPADRCLPADKQGLVAAVRRLAGAARRAREAAPRRIPAVAGRRGGLLLRDLGLPHLRDQGGPQFPDAVGPGLYFGALIARFLTVLLLSALVIRDIMRPEHDVVRDEDGADDPAGGVLNGAPDRLVLALTGEAKQAARPE